MPTTHTPARRQEPAPLDTLLDTLLAQHRRKTAPALDRLWNYYRNPQSDDTDAAGRRRYRLAQECGLPPRLLEPNPASPTPRERVIENDIAWRVHALVDFMFGRPVTLQSLAPHRDRATDIENFLRRVFDLAGGIGFFQDMALLGSVYGFVDVLLRVEPTVRGLDDLPATPADALGHAHRFALEIVDPPRAVPVLDPSDYRRLDAYAIHYVQTLNRVEPDSLLRRLSERVLGTQSRRATVEYTEVWTDQAVRLYRGPSQPDITRRLVEHRGNRIGRVPVIHIQNLPQPFFFEGLSDVEPLVPLQDELNIRLSDRANRVTFQSFKMYLGKGIDEFTQRPVGPGQMWATDNTDASIEEFGGDAASPSEESHIQEIREAMDKTSGVSPIAAGLIRDKLGNLTSESALRIVLMGLLAKTEKKRVTYGSGIERLVELVLHAADVLGVLPNTPDERRIRLDWPSPIPTDQSQRLRDAEVKLRIGVPAQRVLAELGYADCAG